MVAGVYVVGVLLPLIRPAFQDVRYDLRSRDALYTAFVVIPVGTVLLEELAFRSVLWGMLSRHLSTWQVLGHDVGAVRAVARHSRAAPRGATNPAVSDTVGGGRARRRRAGDGRAHDDRRTGLR